MNARAAGRRSVRQHLWTNARPVGDVVAGGVTDCCRSQGAMMERPRWMMWAFVAVQLLLPLIGVWLR
jgi:hypothetical protein